MGIESISKEPELSREQIAEKGKDEFKGSYEKALALRDLFRGYGEWGSESGVEQFNHRLSFLTEKAANIGERLITDKEPIQPDLKDQMLDIIDEIGKDLTRFEAKTGIKLPFDDIDGLKDAIRKEDGIRMIRLAVGLKQRFSGLEAANEILLAESDKITGTHNPYAR